MYALTGKPIRVAIIIYQFSLAPHPLFRNKLTLMANKTIAPTKRTFQQAFESTFHRKYKFSEFLQIDTESECEIYTEKRRTIAKPSERLKDFHRFLAGSIFEYAKFNENVLFSYRKGKNAYDAVVKHANSKYFYQTDIENFFSNLTYADVAQVLERNFESFPITDVSNHKEIILNLVTLDKKVPIGFSTSPVISNLSLIEFDDDIELYCKNNNLIYTRYSDDLLISSDDKNTLENAEEYLTKSLHGFFSERLRINKQKTKHLKKGSKVKLLGMVVLPNGSISVDIKIKKIIEAQLYLYINDKEKFIDFLGGDYEKGLSKVSGTLNYINTVDPNYINKLKIKYGNTIIDMFFHKSVK